MYKRQVLYPVTICFSAACLTVTSKLKGEVCVYSGVFNTTSKCASNLLIDYQPEYYPEDDKKNYQVGELEPDLTRGAVIPLSVPSCYEYPYTEAVDKYSNGIQRSCSEHHYDVPHLHSPPSPSSHSVTSFTCSCKFTVLCSRKRKQLCVLKVNSGRTRAT